MSDILPTPSSPWQESLLNYLMGGMDQTGLQPSLYPAQLGGLWGYVPEGADADTGTSNYVQDWMQMQMDPAMAAQAGMMAFDPTAFQPTTSYTPVDQPGTRALMQYLNRPGTIEYEIANEILNNGGTASSAIGKLQQAYNATGGDLSGLDPEEQALFSQLPTFQDMGQTVVDWEGLFKRGQDLESAALQDPQPGSSSAIYDAQGNMVSGGGTNQMMFDANGNPQLVEVNTEASPLGEWARENGLTPPDVQYTPEMLLGQDWMQQQQNYSDTQAMIDAAMQQWMDAQGPRQEAEAKAAQIRDTQQFLGGLQPSPFGPGQTGLTPPGEQRQTDLRDLGQLATQLGMSPPGGWGWPALAGAYDQAMNNPTLLTQPAGVTGLQAATQLGQAAAGGARTATALGSEVLTNPGAANATAQGVPGLVGAGLDWLFNRGGGSNQEQPQQYNVQLPQVPQMPTPTTAPGSEGAPWNAMPQYTPPGSENAPWGQMPTPTPTTAPGSEGAPWGTTQAMLNYAYGPTAFPMQGQQTGPPNVAYPRYDFAGGGHMAGAATGLPAQGASNYGETGQITSGRDVNTPAGQSDFWSDVFNYIVQPGDQSGGSQSAGGQGQYGVRGPSPMERAMSKVAARTQPRERGDGEGEGNGSIDLPGPTELLSGGTPTPQRANVYVQPVVTGEQAQTETAQEQPAEAATATGEVRRRRRRAPTTAQLRGNSLVTPPQSEQRYMSGSDYRRGQLRQAQRDLWSQREQIWGEDYGRAAAISDWARQNGVTPFQQQMLARRMVPLAMGVPQTNYLPGR